MVWPRIPWFSWLGGALLALFIAAVPFYYYRATYTYGKRLRVVSPGLVYRSGSLTAGGFRDAIRRHGIRTILNLQDEAPDPALPEHYFGGGVILESELCQQLGTRFVYLPPDLIPLHLLPGKRPAAIERFLAIMDDPASYPVLIHCRAGLHRTGVLTALYRMEYQGWTPAQAIRELKGHGFGNYACTSANDYIAQYITTYQPGRRLQPPEHLLLPEPPQVREGYPEPGPTLTTAP